ncbi:hypothetical protein AVEN_126397-1 [Araneus ventricosus]|uniref:CCHC-type domain-containing protein n=1 Tax=Araneus ventricosus TaxID=182803 RepID=A0A4Y2GGM4_ARAVE|nr:hypothetical protein AVEN_126397-1 [Araneus ventricosus]
MFFLKGEVEGEERISLAMSGFGVTKGEDVKMPRKKKYNLETQRGKLPTRATDVKKPKCIFCDGKHASSEFFNAHKLTLEEKQKIVRDRNCCFACLLPGHSVRKCRKFLKCPVCSKKHVTLICDQLQTLKNANLKKEEEENPSGNDVNLSNVIPNPKVFLQTFKAKLLSSDKEKTVRVLCYTGSENVGARLTNSVIEALNWKEVKCDYWGDSTTVLAWLSSEENWSVFVRNRVQEIRKLTSPLAWNHVVGELNPADLPSRGCTATQLMSLRWWEGPKWLTEPLDFWRHGNILNEDINEDGIEKEKSKSIKSLANTENIIQCNRIYSFFSKYQQLVRLVGWVLRFEHNCLCTKEERTRVELTSSEFHKAELKLVSIIQQESIEGEDSKKLKGLAVFVDEDKILRVKT